MPSMKILDYTIRDTKLANTSIGVSNQETINPSTYATHEEIEALTARIDALRAEIDSMGKKGAGLNE